MTQNSLKPNARKEEFLDLAEELFASMGYENTSVDRIVSEIGLSKGAAITTSDPSPICLTPHFPGCCSELKAN